ncbi:MAP7 domain-containing protein 1-like isoform X5 [Mya arenaria]|uniref:MAP7 domain-containing protein 1-like isoform X5 n=1 Tax=Mya arenaria TaxID=6604 RepID=UPI0022DEEAFE|nr:MAP7 domain-containing protein 1-like isoform X5 [Mya arenaria]
MSKVRWWDSDLGTCVDSGIMEKPGSFVDADDPDADMNTGTDVDGVVDDHNHHDRMGSESPSSELEHLHADHSSDNESMKSGTEGRYEVNPEHTQSPNADKGVDNEAMDIGKENISDNVNSVVSDSDNSYKGGKGDFKEPAEKKMKSDRRVTDSFLLEKRSGDGSGKLNETIGGSRPSSVASSGKSGTPSKDKDPARKEKEREREDRIRQAQQKLAEERQRKIDEMREQQRLAQENREKQLDARRRKIEDLKRREEERRKQVEDRRRLQEETDRVKKEAILSKAKERLTRYEQWKTHGRKGGRRTVLGFGSRTPREVCFTLDARRSSSQSTLRRSPNNYDFESYFNRRAVSASSVVRRHCCIDINKLTQGIASAPPTRHKSSVNLTSGVKMRDPSKTSPRKPRPSSVATSMPSFVRVETDTPKSSRSKSTDRGPRDGSKSRGVPRKEEDKFDGKERKAATLPRPYDRKKIEERRQEVKKKQEERKELAREKERMTKSEVHEESKDMGKPPPRLSRSFIERMAVPKHPSHPSPDKKEPVKESTPVKVARRSGPITAPVATKPQAKTPVREKQKAGVKDSPAKAKVEVRVRDSSEDTSETLSSPAPSGTPPARATPTIQVDEVTEVKVETEAPTEERPKTESPVEELTPAEGRATPEPSSEAKVEPKPSSVEARPSPKPDAKAEAKPKTDKEREMEEYKAKLAERRRLAREKAEREAEIERLKQEELERQEEERQQLEEERQRRDEEESLRLAAEARQLEEERLRKAIEAEDKRKAEEAERADQERQAKEDAERKSREEAERHEKEMAERAKREEEERNERRKRLEMIMKRVKTDSTPTSTPEKARTDSPTRVITGSSSRTSLVSSEDERSADDLDKDDGLLKPEEKSDDTPKFKSPLLQKLTDKSGDSSTPKFKSPLLQSIMGKTKIGARLSGTKLDEMVKSTDSLSESKSTEYLSEKELAEKDQDDLEKDEDTSEKDIVTNGVHETEICDSGDRILEDIGSVTRSDVISQDSVVISEEEDNEEPKPLICDSMTTSVLMKGGITDSQLLIGSTADSAVSMSFTTNGVTTSQNGDLHQEHTDFISSKDFVDSSISVRTVDSPESPEQGGSRIGVTLVDTQITPPTPDSSPFEEIIDLSGLPAKPVKSAGPLGDSIVTLHEEGSSVNNFDGVDNGHVSVPGDTTVPLNKPFIAFEENATRQDVPDLLS